MSLEVEDRVELSELRAASIEYFVSFVQMLGLPKSIGQIYGVLFVSTKPLSMDDIISILGISKGSASQGLSLLKTLGAVTSSSRAEERCERYEADMQVSRIASHFFNNRLEPRFEIGERRLEEMIALAQIQEEEGVIGSKGLVDRIEALRKWHRRGRSIVPKVLKWLGRLKTPRK